MKERMEAQAIIMKEFGGVRQVGDRTEPTERFQNIANRFNRAWQPGKSLEAIRREIQ